MILQHPLEACHPKGTARLLHLCLNGSQLVAGESFDQAYLKDLLYRPRTSQAGKETQTQPVLLYPDTQDLQPAPDSWNESMAARPLRLVILDGTWRKSRKMLHANTPLQVLPRLSLSGLRDLPASRYTIRRAHQPDQLSTLEAAFHALTLLEGDESKYQPLLQAFDQFIALQKQWFQQ